MNRRNFLLGGSAAAAGLTIGVPARAQSAPIKVVTGFAPGGSADSLARLVAELLQAQSGRPTIVENRTGAAGRLAVDQVKRAAADGDTLLLAPHGPMTLFPYVFKSLSYVPAKDFTPITRVASGDYALTIGPMVPAKDFAGLRQWLRTAGDRANYGSPGAGTVPHFLGVAVARQMGVPMTHVPYRGSTLTLADVAGGQLAMAVSPLTEALPLHKSGKVRVLATFGSALSPFVEGVPTLKESGADIDVSTWFAVYGPAGMPAAVTERLRNTIAAGLNAPAAKERLAVLALAPAPSTTQELIELQTSESRMWAPLVKASGFTPDD